MKISQELNQQFYRLGHAHLNEFGQEVPNSVPAYASVTPKPLTITEQIQRLMRVELSRQAAEQGFESFDESDDFEDEEFDDGPQSGYQQMIDEVPAPKPKKASAKVQPKVEPAADAPPDKGAVPSKGK